MLFERGNEQYNNNIFKKKKKEKRNSYPSYMGRVLLQGKKRNGSNRPIPLQLYQIHKN